MESLKTFRPASTIFEIAVGSHSLKKNAPSKIMMKAKRDLHKDIIMHRRQKEKTKALRQDEEEEQEEEISKTDKMAASREIQRKTSLYNTNQDHETEAHVIAQESKKRKNFLSVAERRKIKKLRSQGVHVDIAILQQEKEGARQSSLLMIQQKDRNPNHDVEDDDDDGRHYIGYAKAKDMAKEDMLRRTNDGGRSNTFAQARLEDAMLDVNPDEAIAMNKKRRLLHWDVRKKKFIKTTVGELKNGTLKQNKHMNGGTLAKKQKVGEAYKKWQQKQHKQRTNIVGADEDEGGNGRGFEGGGGPKVDYRNGKPRIHKHLKSELRSESAIRKEERKKARSQGDFKKADRMKASASSKRHGRGKGNIAGKSHGAPTKSKLIVRRH